MFADDCRLSHTILNLQDASNLQHDLNNVVQWIQDNKLQINELKCHKITFGRISDFYNFSYMINNTIIQPVDMIRDLGIILDSNRSFDHHLRSVITISFKTLGFIKRTTCHFSSTDTIIHLFKTLVLPNLSFESVIWSPNTKNDFDSLNSVIKRFLRYIAFKLGKPMDFGDHDYSAFSLECKIFNLESTHRLNDLNFVLELAPPTSTNYSKNATRSMI